MKAIKKTTAFFLAMVFILSSLGFTINKMVCLKSGKVKISFIHLKDCCPETDSSVTVKTQCCDISNSSFHLNDFSTSEKNTISVADGFVFQINNYSFTPQNSSGPASKLVFADLPPPFYGRQLLSFISVLII